MNTLSVQNNHYNRKTLYSIHLFQSKPKFASNDFTFQVKGNRGSLTIYTLRVKTSHSLFFIFCLLPYLSSYGDHVQHFKVLQDRCGQYYVWDEGFASLNELVDFYHSNSIAKERTVFLRDPEHFARVSSGHI